MWDFDELEKAEIDRVKEAFLESKMERSQEPSRSHHKEQLQIAKFVRAENWYQSPSALRKQTEYPESSHIESNAIALVKAELELEAEAERRHWQRDCGKGLHAAMIRVTLSESLLGEKKHDDGQKNSTPFCAAVIHSIICIYKLLDAARRNHWDALEEGWIVYPNIIAIELFLFHIMPSVFLHGVVKHCERICVLLGGRTRGLHSLISGLLHREPALSIVKRTLSDVRLVLQELRYELLNLIEFLLDPLDATLDKLNEARENLHTVAEMTEASQAERMISLRESTPRPSGYVGEWCCIVRTSPLTCSCLLYDLRKEFRAEKFQTRYQELRKKARMNGSHHAEMVNLTFAVQKKVLPKYGFGADAAGVNAMRFEVGFHADVDEDFSNRGILSCCGDKVIAKLRRDIHMCLDMDIQKSERLPVLHTVGDSHSTFGWPKCVIQHWQGPLLCYNVDRVDLLALKPPIQEGDAVCFCFGEIDCRCHVHKHCNEDTPYQQVIDGIVSHYFAYLNSQLRLLPGGVKFFVYNVPPPVRRCDAQENIQFPYLGEDEERRSYVLYFNHLLREECKRSCFRFFDVYIHYADEDGFLSREYSDGNVHISDGTWIDELIREQNFHLYRPSQINFKG